MSKNLDKALEVLDVGKQTPPLSHRGMYMPGEGKCWRCLRNPSRVAGEDFTCDGCFAYLNGETDEDPKRRFW